MRLPPWLPWLHVTVKKAFGGTGLPPCAAYDFSCELRGTFARTVEPGEKGMPPNFKGAPAAATANAEITFSVTKIWLTKANLFKKLLSCITCGKPTISSQQISSRPVFVGNRQKGSLLSLSWMMTLSCFQAPLRLCEISFVDFKPDESFHATALSGNGRVSDAEKRIKHRTNS